MKWLTLTLVILMAGCSGQSPTATTGLKSRQATASPAPSAPIELHWRMPSVVNAGQPLSIEANITTPIKSGSLVVSVAGAQGVTLLADPFQRVDLGSAQQPLPVTLDVLPGAESQRYVVLLVSVETASTPVTRSFRIALPDDSGEKVQEQAPAQDGLKLLPATPVR